MAKLFKSLRATLFLTEQQKKLDEARIDKSHALIPEEGLKKIKKLLCVPKSQNLLLSHLQKRFKNGNSALQIKSLVVMHTCLRLKMVDGYVQNIFSLDLDSSNSINLNIGQQEQDASEDTLQKYIREGILSFYVCYLKKICAQKDSYEFAKKTASVPSELIFKKNSLMEIITHGFAILNIISFMLGCEQMLNKMGRYHIQRNQIFNMYLQLLKDLDFFNAFLKKIIRHIMENIVKNQKSRLDLALQKLIKNGYEIDGIVNEEEESEEQVQHTQHIYLLIYEAQKISDNLYIFYSNQYFLSRLRKMRSYPDFLQISSKEFAILQSKTKRLDWNLINNIKTDRSPGTQRSTGSTFTKRPKNKKLHSSKSLILPNYCFSKNVIDIDNVSTLQQNSMKIKDQDFDIEENWLPEIQSEIKTESIF